MSDQGPLGGLRVVDLSDLRAALCGRMLADLGAEVVWVHHPDDPLDSLGHLHRHANKKGMSLDLYDVADRARLDPLLATADVLIDNLGPVGHHRFDLGPDTVSARHPHLVRAAIADLGLDGPLAHWRLEALPALAASGGLFASGFRELPPCWMPGHLAHDAASAYAAIGVVAAVMARRRTGRGQLIEVSVQEAAMASTVPWSILLEDYARLLPGLPTAGRRNADGVYWVLPAKDGWVRTVIGNPRQWQGFVDLLGRPEVLTQPEWDDPTYRLRQHDVIRLVAGDLLSDRTRQELFDEALGTGATIGMLLSPSEFVAQPQEKARGTFEPLDIPGAVAAPAVRTPFRLSVTPPPPRRNAPSSGVDCIPHWDPRPRPAQSEPARLLLNGIRVVEFGMAAVVPEVAGILSELGADVIKIESIVHPDVLRQTGRGRINCGFAFNAECRGRRSVALDLSTRDGRRLAQQLCASADVVLENFRGGGLDGLGLGYAEVAAGNPTVVYASSQGYGRGGPLDQMPAYGPLNLGFAGLHHLWNHPEAPYPCGTSLNHPDHMVSKVLGVAVLAALAHRDATGQGQHVEVAQAEGVAYLMGEVYLETALGVDRGAAGNRNDAAAPHGVYPCTGDDQWVAIAVADDDAWQRFRTVAGWPADPALSTLAGRLAVRDDLDGRVGAWTAGRDRWEVANLLQAHGVSAMPVLGPDDHHRDDHLATRRAIVTLYHPEVGPERHVANPLRLSSTPQRRGEAAPCLGADTKEVLTTVLGCSEAEVADLVARGVCR